MNLFRNKNLIKNELEEDYDLPQDLDILNKWSIPKIEPKVIYRLGTFEKLGLKQIVKTTEETVSLNKDDIKIRLLQNKDLNKHKGEYKFIHIGLVQVAFKPLTLEGLPESFIAALRDARNLDWQQSLMGIIQTSLAHGPVYFNVYPNLQLSLTDVNILDALTLNVKTHGYNYAPGSEVICICYRIYYKPLYTLNPNCKMVDKPLNETILIETNFSKSDITTRRTIKWEEIEFPDNWVIERAVPPMEQRTQNNPTKVIQTVEGDVHISFDPSRRSLTNTERPRTSRSGSSRYHIAPYFVKSPSTSQMREEEQLSDRDPNNIVEEFKIGSDNIVKGVYNTKDADLTASEMNFSC